MIYSGNKQTGKKGWVHAADKMQFLPWINFYNLYGRKYGINILKDAPKDTYTLHSQCEDNSQSISKLNYVKKIIQIPVTKQYYNYEGQ